MTSSLSRTLWISLTLWALALWVSACTGTLPGELAIGEERQGGWSTADAVVVSDDVSSAAQGPEDGSRVSEEVEPQVPEQPVEDTSSEERIEEVSAPVAAEDTTSEGPEEPLEPQEDVEESEPIESEPEVSESLCGDALCEPSEDCASCPQDCPLCRPAPGELIVTEIMQNPKAVSDALGEWFEVLSLADEERSLKGLTLRDADSDGHIINAELTIAPGQRLIFAASFDLGVGLQADYVWTSFYLGNASDFIVFEDGDLLIDAVAYGGDEAWPDPSGASMKLASSALNAGDNDLGSNWCEAVMPYGAGDLGSPGEANLDCGQAPPSICGDGVCAEDELCDQCLDDCGLCPCPEGEARDCSESCAPLALIGDGACDAGWDCIEQGFDGGDCLEPGCGVTLFFSEYVEGSGNTKALELFNPTSQVIDLADYALWKITNGGNWGDESMKSTELEGSVAPGEVFVFCHTKLSESLPEVCDQLSGGNPMNFNGDDALGLAYQGVLVDAIGLEGEDPGIGWALNEVENATQDHTLVRAPEVTVGDLGWSASGLSWIVYDKDQTQGLGTHEVSLPCTPSDAP